MEDHGAARIESHPISVSPFPRVDSLRFLRTLRYLPHSDMLTTEDCERALVESILGNVELDASVDALLARLLANIHGYSARATDGVIFEHSRINGRQAMASGVVVMIEDQTVEPVRVEFTLDAAGTTLSTASVHFGDTTRTVGFGSKEDRMLRHAIIVNPAADFPWKERFHRNRTGWHHAVA